MENLIEAMKLLGLVGRVHLEWVSASEGAKFKETVTEFVEQIRALGPSPLRVEWARTRKFGLSRAAAGGVAVRGLFFQRGMPECLL